jgi:hypothetical protein
MKSKFKSAGIILIGMMLFCGQFFGVNVVMAQGNEKGPATALVEPLNALNDDHDSVVAELAEFWAGESGYPVEQFELTFGAATAEQLLEIGEAADLEEVNNILIGICDPDKDYVFTPVTPCRIVDTRNAGGAFGPDQVREFFVYGTTNIVNQGGNPAGCFSPKGEPRGVHINVTAVPVSGQGNFAAFPANISPPNASLINYKAGVQNIANAASVKTYYQIGTGGLKVINRVGTSHLVIDVMGYYYELPN